ncbi:hypothetical protein ACFQBQ_08800 [Granulicella cerasi]|uniref:Uncharacterized protein n=1 Tax=Granulicella cerasi TaxID=741063 RepID=A0ABW1Z8E3_9BACT|nr:hypothetical protein [Granulicella cerasi]
MAQPISAPKSSLAHPSDQQPLAKAEGLGSITQCSCGTLSLNVQAFSLRLDLQSFAKLLLMCSEAMDSVERGLKNSSTTATLVH